MMRYRVHIKSWQRTLVNTDAFSLVPDEITVLFGESGIGKTLLAQAIFGLLDPEELHIRLNGQDYRDYLRSKEVKQLRENGFFVFQEPSTHLNPLLSIGEQLREGSLARATNERAVLEALWQKSFERQIAPLLKVYPKPFRPSGGEKQRFLLAMAFKKLSLRNAGAPGLFVFDEPTGSLDNRYRNIFLRELMQAYAQNPFTCLLITHDYSMISVFEHYHAAMLPHIHFKELQRAPKGKVHMVNFEPRAYTNWLNKQTVHTSAKTFSKEKTVLKVEPSFRVFGKEFFFSREGEGERVPLQVQAGQLVYLKAPSGLGKTTLAKIIAGLQKAERIRFELAGIPLNEQSNRKVWRKHIWGKRLAMVFQHADEALNLQARVRDVFKGLPGREATNPQKIRQGLKDFFDRSVSERFLNQKVAYLSGGQKQRLNLLRAFLLQPYLLILDEPLNGLDFESLRKVIEMIQQKRAAGSGVLLISHNEEIFDHIVPPEDRYRLHCT